MSIPHGPAAAPCALLASDLMSAETYARDSRGWHTGASAHRAARTIRLGANAILAFEDERTVRYQIQEMLRVEQISDPSAVQSEIDAFARRIPDGANLKATLTIEYADAAARRAWRDRLAGIEHNVWLRVEGCPPVFAAVAAAAAAPSQAPALAHELTFELGPDGAQDFAAGGAISIGIDHNGYQASLTLDAALGDLLRHDLLAA